MRTVGNFRIMCRDEAPTLRTVNTRQDQATSVLNLNLVSYWTPEGQASPWIKLTLWGAQAEKFVDLVEHNQAVYVDGDLQFDGYVTEAYDSDGNEKPINRISPVFKKVAEFRLVNVVKTQRAETEATPTRDPIAERAGAAAAGRPDYDDIPF